MSVLFRDGESKRRRRHVGVTGQGPLVSRSCPSCGYVSLPSVPACPSCGVPFDPDGDGDSDVAGVVEGALDRAFDEALHPRGRGGKWTAKLGRMAELHRSLPNHNPRIQAALDKGDLHAGDAHRILEKHSPESFVGDQAKKAELRSLAHEAVAHMQETGDTSIHAPGGSGGDALPGKAALKAMSDAEVKRLGERQNAGEFNRHPTAARKAIADEANRRSAVRRREGEFYKEPDRSEATPRVSHDYMGQRVSFDVSPDDDHDHEVSLYAGEWTHRRSAMTPQATWGPDKVAKISVGKAMDLVGDPSAVATAHLGAAGVGQAGAKEAGSLRRSLDKALKDRGLRVVSADGGGAAQKFKPGDRVQHRDGGAQGKVSGDMANGRVPVKFTDGSRDPNHVFMVKQEDLESLERPGQKKPGSKMSRRSGHGLLAEAVASWARKAYDDALHPRGRRGEWVAKLGALRDFGHIDTPGGGTLHKLGPGRYGYSKPGTSFSAYDTVKSPEAAVDAALPDIEAHHAAVSGRHAEDPVAGTGQHVTLFDRPHDRPPDSRWPRGEVGEFKKGDKVQLPDGRVGTIGYSGSYGAQRGSYGVDLEDGSRVPAKHEELRYAPEHFEKLQAKLDRAQKGKGAPSSADLLKSFVGMKFPVGTAGPRMSEIPAEWKVENGYGKWRNPAMRNPALGAEVGFMPDHPLHGKTGTVTRAGYYQGQEPGGAIPARSGSLLFDVKVGGKTHTVTSQDIYDSNLAPVVQMGLPGTRQASAEEMLYHYLVGHPPSNKFYPGSPGHQQWVYGLPKKAGGSGPVKAANKAALLRKITQAVAAFERGDFRRCGLLIEAACDIRSVTGPLLDANDLSEGGGYEGVAERAGMHALGSWDPVKHPRARGGRFADVLGHLRANGYWRSPIHNISVERGRLGGYTVHHEGHQRSWRVSADDAAHLALEKADVEDRRLGYRTALIVQHPTGEIEKRVAMRSPGGERDLSPGGPVKVASAARDKVAQLLRNVGYDHEAKHVQQRGEIRHENLSDSMLGEVASTLRYLGGVPAHAHGGEMDRVAAGLEHELGKRFERDRVPVDSRVSSRGGSGVSKAQALVDSGLADDLADARAQLADMGERGGLLSPGHVGVKVLLSHFTVNDKRVHQVLVNGMPVHAETENEGEARARAEKLVGDYTGGRIPGVGARRVSFAEWDGDKGEHVSGPTVIEPSGGGLMSPGGDRRADADFREASRVLKQHPGDAEYSGRMSPPRAYRVFKETMGREPTAEELHPQNRYMIQPMPTQAEKEAWRAAKAARADRGSSILFAPSSGGGGTEPVSHFDRISGLLREHEGKQVRLTHPLGTTVTGVAGVDRHHGDEATLDREGGLSIFSDASRFEVKEPGESRFRVVGEFPEVKEKWERDNGVRR